MRTRVLMLIGALMMLAACVPSDPVSTGPIAVRAGESIEVLYTACDPAGVVSVALVQPTKPPEFRESDPPIWKVSFPTASRLTQFVVGQTPPGATEEVALPGPLNRDTLYTAVVTLDNGLYHRIGFKLNEMGQRVAYDNRYVSVDEFDRARSCTTHT